MVPVVTSGNIKYVDCPDFWVNTSKITDSSDNVVDVSAGCYVTNTSSWHNIGKCIPYESGGVSYLDYCVHDSNAHTLTNSQYANNLANNYYVGLDLASLQQTSDCDKYRWAKLNEISWNGISNNYNLINGCNSK